MKLTLFLVFNFFLVVFSKKPLVIAHRGYSGKYPEHTYPSYLEAIHAKADFIEMDICSSKDHELFVMHSMELSEITNIADHPEFASRKTTKIIPYNGEETGWFIEDFTSSELKLLKVHQRFSFRSQIYNNLFHLLTFEEVLKFSNSSKVGIYVETKYPTYYRKMGLPLEDKMIDLLVKYNFIDSTFQVNPEKKFYLQSFESTSLKYFYEKIKNVQNVQLISANLNFIVNDTGKPVSDFVTPSGLDEIKTYASTIGPAKKHIGIPGKPLPEEHLLSLAHQRNLDVHIYTLRDDVIDSKWKMTAKQEVQYFINLGVDGYFTDFPSTGVQARDDIPENQSQPYWLLGVIIACLFISSIVSFGVILAFIIEKLKTKLKKSNSEYDQAIDFNHVQI
eukprot:gene9984-2303_t